MRPFPRDAPVGIGAFLVIACCVTFWSAPPAAAEPTTEAAKFVAELAPIPPAYSGMKFGSGVAGQGNLVAVSAPDLNGDEGRVDIYVISADRVDFGVTLVPPTPSASESFGYTLSWAASDLLVVGAPHWNFWDGRFHTYKVNATHASYLNTADNPTSEDEAFVSSGLASASGVVFAGAHRHNIDGHDVGRTYRYAVDTSGDINLVCEFTPPSLLMSDAKFGVGVAYNGGDLLIVSASRASFGLSFEGAVYIYKVDNGTGCVTETDRFLAATRQARSSFGSSVAMAGDYLVVGQDRYETGTISTGRASLYTLNSDQGTATVLAEMGSLQMVADSYFGSSVAVTADGIVAVGASSVFDDEVVRRAGTFVFVTNATTGTVELDGSHFIEWSNTDRHPMSIFGGYLAVGTIGGVSSHGSAFVYNLGTPTGVLTVNSGFCTAQGEGNFTGGCLAAAFAQAAERPGAIGTIKLEPGLYTGCPSGGIVVARADLLVTTTSLSSSPSSLPPAASPDVVWSCGSANATRHLRLDAASNITFVGIGFVSTNGADGDGGVAHISMSSGISFDRCYFSNVSTNDGNGGAIFATGSTVTVSNSVAVNTTAPLGNGGYIYSSDGIVEVTNTTVAGASSGRLGGAVCMDDGVIYDSEFSNCSAKLGGTIYAALSTGTVSIVGSIARHSRATVSGGAIFVDTGNPDVVSVSIVNTTVSDSSAGAVGGGIAIRADSLVEAPGPRLVHLVDLTVSNCHSKRGGGLFSEVDTTLIGSTLVGNSADESGGGAAFQPAPCLASVATIDRVLFESNSAGTDGGGLFVSSSAAIVTASHFDRNFAAGHGAGMALECEAEICVGEVPRDTCEVVTGNISSTSLVLNYADGDGGGVYVTNRALHLSTTGSLFDGNAADRGAAVFATINAAVAVDAFFGEEARVALSSAADASQVIASPPVEAVWEAAPVLGTVMPGDNLCATEDKGCALSIRDAFGNTPMVPTLVEIGVENPAVTRDGPQFVLVAGGISDPIPDLALQLVVNGGSMPIQQEVTFVGIRFPTGTGSDRYSDGANVTLIPCQPGFGLAGDNLGAVWCEPCAPGTYSEELSWHGCSTCGFGTATQPGTVGAEACTWCDAGHGWHGGACTVCDLGTYSDGVTFEQACTTCGAGLTTSGDQATVCGIVVTAPQDVDKVAVIVTAAIIVVGIVAVVVSCIRKRDASHGAIATVLLSVYDVITDYLFLFSLVDQRNNSAVEEADGLGTLIAIGAGSIGAAFMINLLLTCYVLLRERRQPAFAKWLRENLVTVAVTAVLGTTNVSVLKALDSGVFAVSATDAPFSSETKDLIEFGGVASVLFEDAPQLLMAILYLSGRDTTGTNLVVVYLTILASAASILSGLLLRLILCCVVGADRDLEEVDSDGGSNGGGVKLNSVNPAFEVDDDCVL